MAATSCATRSGSTTTSSQVKRKGCQPRSTTRFWRRRSRRNADFERCHSHPSARRTPWRPDTRRRDGPHSRRAAARGADAQAGELPAARRQWRNLVSSSLSVGGASACRCSRTWRSDAGPRRPDRASPEIRRCNLDTVVSLRRRADSTARSSRSDAITAPTSTKVRVGSVHRMPSTSTTSKAARSSLRWTVPEASWTWRGTVTSTTSASMPSRPHRSAAARCDATASGLDKHTAASDRSSTSSGTA